MNSAFLRKMLVALSKRPLIGRPIRALSRRYSGGHSSPVHLSPAHLAHNKAQFAILAEFEAQTANAVRMKQPPL